jgi:hypothetical protein
MKITVKYGMDEHKLESISPPTIQTIKQSDTLKAILGFGDNVRALIDGVEQPNGLLVPDGATVLLETTCNTKAQPVLS